MLKSKIQSLLFLSSIFLFSCAPDSNLPVSLDLSKKIIGEWQQVSVFNLVDESSNPQAYDWFAVEDGFLLRLNENGTFDYTKYTDCITGRYVFYPDSKKIEFNFDCEINFNGVSVSKITEFFDGSPPQNDRLLLEHARSSDLCRESCMSILKRVE
jgi:hypothetical protein